MTAPNAEALSRVRFPAPPSEKRSESKELDDAVPGAVPQPRASVVPGTAWEALQKLRSGDLQSVRAYLESLPSARPPRGELRGPLVDVTGAPRVVRGGAWESLVCGHEVFVPSAHKPGTRKRRHCPTCGGAQ